MNKLVYALIGLTIFSTSSSMYHGPDGYHNRHQRMSSAPVFIPRSAQSSKKESLEVVWDSLTQEVTKHSPDSRATVIAQLVVVARELKKLEESPTHS